MLPVGKSVKLQGYFASSLSENRCLPTFPAYTSQVFSCAHPAASFSKPGNHCVSHVQELAASLLWPEAIDTEMADIGGLEEVKKAIVSHNLVACPALVTEICTHRLSCCRYSGCVCYNACVCGLHAPASRLRCCL